MKKDKITLKELSAYFPYEVKVKFKDKNTGVEIETVSEIAVSGHITCYDTVNAYPTKFKLLLHPLSWLTDEILSDINCDLGYQMIMAEFRDKRMGYWNLDYGVIQILLENHVDCFGLIERGLAEPIK